MNQIRLPTLLESRRVVAFFVAVLIAAVALSLIYTIFAIRQSQVRNGEVLRIVKGCTTPGQPCAERAKKQTATAVADINRVAVIAAACVDQRGEQTVTEIRICVMNAISREVAAASE